MSFLDWLFGRPVSDSPVPVEPAPEGEAVPPERFGHFAFAFVHDHLFLGRGSEPWVSEFQRAAGLDIDDLQIAFRTEYLILLLGAIRHAVYDRLGPEVADLVIDSSINAAIDAFSEQLGRDAEQFDWRQIRDLMDEQSREYMESAREQDGTQTVGKTAFPRLVPEHNENDSAERCLTRQYQRVLDRVNNMLTRNPISV